MITKRAIVIGSGASVRQGYWNTFPDRLPVWNLIRNEYTIGINWIFKFFIPTVTMYSDYEFYIAEKNDLSNLPLVFSRQSDFYSKQLNRLGKEIFHLHDNIYLLPNRKAEYIDGKRITYHGTDAWTKGFYSKYLTGQLALHFAIACGCTEIYLLGMDCCEIDGRTHFYQDEIIPYRIDSAGKKHTGVGKTKDGKYKTSVYDTQDSIDGGYEPFKAEYPRVKIYNVSPQSKLNMFPKITYDEFYQRLLNEPSTAFQDDLRDAIEYKYYENYLR